MAGVLRRSKLSRITTTMMLPRAMKNSVMGMDAGRFWARRNARRAPEMCMTSFPLLALDALIVAVDLRGRAHEVSSPQEGVTPIVQNIPDSVVLLLLAVIIVVAVLIIRAVWRAVNKA